MKKVIYTALAFAPALAFAADFTAIKNLVNSFKGVLDSLIPVIFGIAIIYFFWGVARYIRAAGDPKEAAAGKSIMIYGIIALAVMASVYGLINFLTQSAGLDNTQVNLPILPPARN